MALGGLGGCSSGLQYNIESADIAREAKRCEGSKDWLYEVEKQPDYSQFSRFPKNSYKCNLLVADVLYRAGVIPPGTHNGDSITSSGEWPIYARQWQGSVPGFKTVSSQTKGCVVTNGVHCGIAVDDSNIMAANSKAVGKCRLTGALTIQCYDE